jgi:hypothetical protein
MLRLHYLKSYTENILAHSLIFVNSGRPDLKTKYHKGSLRRWINFKACGTSALFSFKMFCWKIYRTQKFAFLYEKVNSRYRTLLKINSETLFNGQKVGNFGRKHFKKAQGDIAALTENKMLENCRTMNFQKVFQYRKGFSAFFKFSQIS